MHQAQVIASIEGMSSHSADAAFSGQAGMSNNVSAAHRLQAKSCKDISGEPYFLVDLQDFTRAHDAQISSILIEPAAQIDLGGYPQDRVGVVTLHSDLRIEGIAGFLRQLVPIVAFLWAIDSYLCYSALAATVQAETGTVRTAIGEFNQHWDKQLPNARLQRWILEVESRDTAHGHFS